MTLEEFSVRLLQKGPTPEQTEHAVLETERALNDRQAAHWLHTYYSETGNYAGSTFLTLEPIEPFRVTPTDLFAASLLSVKIHPSATRRILSKELQDRLTELLRAIPPAADLATADLKVWRAADELYQTCKYAFGKNPWVTASKLCSRKRPQFFPVRDEVVTIKRLGAGKDRLTDWQVYKHLMKTGPIVERLHQLEREVCARSGVLALDPPLRILDVLLWMSTPKATDEARRLLDGQDPSNSTRTLKFE
ncbi:hypothetical protein HMPREF0591_2096 [Mycobacterium parascrofulaceum ATCC BAA-614]|uniref:Uncharacterized protein n=1 Tax=Mycobacterium parascrofulaceum ATCC BAA-614 TaxID=525368 RepID=D5P7F2_9MYCO|nr:MULTISPECIES: DUF6308 family protein [Mycobacterium]EFG77967.1 hypothetical protein HMPREF0591_2096 [Mycobacterium parascrofulaceum ATCC BAA-614]